MSHSLDAFQIKKYLQRVFRPARVTPEIKKIMGSLNTGFIGEFSESLKLYNLDDLTYSPNDINFTNEYMIYRRLNTSIPYLLNCQELPDIYNFTLENKTKVLESVNKVFSSPFLFEKNKINLGPSHWKLYNEMFEFSDGQSYVKPHSKDDIFNPFLQMYDWW